MAALGPVVAFWQEFDLDNKWRSKLDEVRGCLAIAARSTKPQAPRSPRPRARAGAPTSGLSNRRARQVGLKIAELQEQSTASRRSLADATKEWKRTSGEPGARCRPLGQRRKSLLRHPPAALACYGRRSTLPNVPPPPPQLATGKVSAPLVKCYQEEIDSLTKRARHAESAFLELYQELYEVILKSCRDLLLLLCWRRPVLPAAWAGGLPASDAQPSSASPFPIPSSSDAPSTLAPHQAPDPAASLSAAMEAQLHASQLEAQVGQRSTRQQAGPVRQRGRSWLALGAAPPGAFPPDIGCQARLG